MLGSILHSRLALTAVSCVALALSSSFATAEDLCSIVPSSYTAAKSAHPELTTAIETLENYAIASWYTDRQSTQERADMMSGLLSQCSEDSRLSMVVYGIPNKDCAGGFSSGGSVTSTSDYEAFLKELTDAVGDRKVLYVVEPDALGLLTQDGGCGSSAGYLDNLKVAVAALSANANAELYLDIGYWMLAYGDTASKVATVMKELGASGRVKGVTINTSNYRSNDECATYCTNFQTAMGSTDMTCIVDTSRNYNGSPTSDWCNVDTAGIGKPPSSETGVLNLDYFMWIKPPGESDGECLGGPSAGAFFLDGFTKLWDQGYFVSEEGMKTIAEGADQAQTTSAHSSGDSSQSQTTSMPTTAPATGSSSWSQDNVATVAPADTTLTEAPSSTSSATTATPNTLAPSSTNPSTTAPETTSPNTTVPTTSPETTSPNTMMPTTTSPAASVAAGETDTAQQSYPTKSRAACKAKKRLRSL